MTPDTALVLCRLLFDAAVILIWGSSAYLCALVSPELARVVGDRLRWLSAAAIAVAFASTVAMLPLRTAIIGDGWSDMVTPEMLGAVLTQTDVGTAWMVQAAGVVLLGATVFLPYRYRQMGRAVFAALLLLSLTLSGHAAMNSGWLRVLHRINDGAHLLSGGAWLGALVPVLLILSMLGRGTLQADARVAVMRFSTAGHVAVALVLLSGAANTLLILGGLPSDWSFSYQRLLSAKIAVVAAMVLIAVINRYVFVPKFARDHSLLQLKICVITEVVLGLVVVALVAWFGTLQPR
ncbi:MULTISPECIES: copper homeostasis membrane protein CopD [unclassified Rhizobium]|uniref:copper homeostasis membrane protein CopD n=1 Tax=unclassified Rhizobium TaxID=2613769 RepID=UPI000DDDC874|nr:copper homeostasis membrane protein CopD [Rhizobium sp. UBA1881]